MNASTHGIWRNRQLRGTKQRIENWIENLLDTCREQGDEKIVDLASHILLAGGKRIRPILCLLVYEMLDGEDEQSVLPLAAAYELIHTATLIHDDINDKSKVRRGVMALHEVAGPAEAQITGDWLFVQGFGLGGRYPNEIVDLMARSCARLAVAELKQISHIYDIEITIEDYYEVIEGKTAGPFSSGCEAAAMLAGSPESVIAGMSVFGMQLGIAFQLVDDLLDLIGDERLGKPRGLDVMEGKITLPLIIALQRLEGSERDRLVELISMFDLHYLPELLQLLQRSGSIDYCRSLVSDHLTAAIRELDVVSDSSAKSLVLDLTHYVRSRYD